MNKLIATALASLLAFAPFAQAKDEPGAFDYWVLALSWSPQYCSENERDLQCMNSYSFVVHGLWPQYETKGWPEECTDVERVDKKLVSRMMAIMPSPPLIQHQWREHGSCSGMNVEDYFLTVERAHRSLLMPSAYYDVADEVRTSVEEIEQAFIRSNEQLSPESIAVTCRGRYLREVRICYDKDFQPRDCGEGVRDRCGKRVTVRPTR